MIFQITAKSRRRNASVNDRLLPMAKLFTLDFHGASFPVPKGSLFDLFEHHPELVTKSSYEVQSSVPIDLFQAFVKALETGTKVPVTKENAYAISPLAKEFWLEDLLSECSALQTAPEQITVLYQRITKLEYQISLASMEELRESIANHERRLESLDCRI
jgi:hypothetical protein